ncbi:MAG TPA: hypothetical protein VJ246_02690 [Patescibacteria group bacterium]|nr:hypothetical protein [Patescibacteria group bacterium]
MAWKSLCESRYLWDSNIPVEIIHEGNYKCRTVWFQSIVADLQILLLGRQIPDNLKKKVNQFIQWCGRELKTKKRITPEDIRRGDEIIDLVLPFKP